MRKSPGVAAIGAVTIIVGLIFIMKNQRFRGLVFHGISHVPIIGTFIHKAYIARSVTTLALTLESGVPILTGLQHAHDVSMLPNLQKMWIRSSEVVRDGLPLHSALAGPDLPPALMQMMIA